MSPQCSNISVTPMLCISWPVVRLKLPTSTKFDSSLFLMRLINFFQSKSTSLPVADFSGRTPCEEALGETVILNWGVFDWHAVGFRHSMKMKTTSPFLTEIPWILLDGCLHSAWNLVACNPSSAVELKFITVGCKWRKSSKINTGNCQYLMTSDQAEGFDTIQHK